MTSNLMSIRCDYYCYRKTKKKIDTVKNNSNQIEMVFFDMDGVLTDTISSWKHIHDYFKTSNEHSVELYLKGKIDDLEFIKRDVSLWKENGNFVHVNIIKNILNDVSLMDGAKNCIVYLKKNNIKPVIVSAGLDILANRVGKEIGIEYIYANGIKNDKNGRLTGDGELRVELTNKDKVVKDIANEMNVSLENCAAVGNSCFDVPMFESCGLGIAFNPGDDCVKKLADFIVEGKDLNKLIPVFKQYV
jgi:phosphoserine phosphatase